MIRRMIQWMLEDDMSGLGIVMIGTMLVVWVTVIVVHYEF